MIPKEMTHLIRAFAQSKHWSFWRSHWFGDWRSLLIPKAISWLTPDFVLLSSVLELIQALDDFVDQHNENPKPFIWTAKANDILAQVLRAKHSLYNSRSV